MSTRTQIRIFSKVENSVKSIDLYHHHDGYPEGVGFDLVTRLSQMRNWYVSEIANTLIKDVKDEYELTLGNHTDVDYLYEIDTNEQTVTCFRFGYNKYCEATNNSNGNETLDIFDFKGYRCFSFKLSDHAEETIESIKKANAEGYESINTLLTDLLKIE